MTLSQLSAELSALFVLGLIGTGHCVGMCGPLTIAFPGRVGRFSAHLLYHAGRITTYTLIGGLLGAVGAIGTGQGVLRETVTLQTIFSLIAALFLILFALVRLQIIREPTFMTALSPHRIPGVQAASRAATPHRVLPMLPLGLAMGLLPCGLSYAAFAKALPAGSFKLGGLYLSVFGLGTLPGLLLIGTVASRFFIKHRRLSDIAAALVMLGMGADLLMDLFAAFS